MKYTLFFFTLFSLSLYGQTWQATSIPANTNNQRFDDVFFLNENLGWAANGYYASVYKTTDGGLSWTEQLNESMLNDSYYFRNIEFLDSNIGFLGTLNGVLFSTNDGGNNWTSVTNISPNPVAICGIDTIGNSTVYGCGAYFSPAFLIKSTDAGTTWEYIDMSAHATALVEVLFTSETTGYASGRNPNGACILKTIDGGLTWTEIFNSNIPGEYVWKLQVLENNNVFFGSISSIAPHTGKLIKSTDNGLTWSSYNAPETDIQAVGFINENIGWMGGHTTGFYETLDGGQTWTDINIGSNLNRIFIISPTIAYASGASIYKYTNETLSTIELLDDDFKNLEIQIANNPVKSNLEFTIYFNSVDNILIELYDSKGSFIKQLSRDIINQKGVNQKYAFNIEDLSSGTYFLNIHNNYNRESLKFIKK